jgi:branched-chain amino acid transport system permease protein
VSEATRFRAARIAPTRLWLGLALIAILLLAIAPLFANSYVVFILTMVAVNALMALGFNFVIGFLGQLVFANTAFFGIGAYAYAILIVHAGFPFPLALVGACAVGAVAGGLIGLTALRLRSFQLAIVTLAFNQLMQWVYLHSGWLGGGPSGLQLPDARFAGIGFTSDAAKYLLILVLTVVFIWIARNIACSTTGRAIVSVGANEFAAAALSMSPVRVKITAFALSGLYSGVAGALFALLLGRVAPESFGLGELLRGFAMVMVGGAGTVTGPVLGAVILTAAPEFLRNIPGAEELLYSFLLIALLLFMPSGLFGGLCALFPGLRERHRGDD